MSTAKTCPHLTQHPDLEVLLVTDAAVTLAEAFVQCRTCRQDYLIELIDIKGPANAFRIFTLPADAAAPTLRSLARGSCDINRATAELAHINQVAQRLPGVLIRDEADSSEGLWRYVADPKNVQVPTEHWRNLACDGEIITALALH